MEEKDVQSKEQFKEEVGEDAEQEIITDNEADESQEQETNNDELTKLQEEKDDLQNHLLRVQAEYDNFRKRTKKEKEADLKYKSQSVVTELLPVLDNFERALQVEVEDKAAKGIVEGLEMVYRQLKTVLESEGVTEIETDGQTFDPNMHQAVMQVEEDGYESNQIVETMQKGYQLKDRVIRPAMVKVNQ
ncbi:nucleotide exchange factor GrpE [Gracilibacillus kekensis]|uniref:Protein GrpE n=1 Tax=Gracilibacillus kekensis TaxID=1027249 RepID=A0A1M7P3K2_9BACI|nr:nucleotide exchange factor GrpE [Gracilibacillus kekensis]SHN11074.1 molecular chaperone GrpE [Gracilibacillus kekensis]